MEDRHPWLSWQTGVRVVNPREPQATGKMPVFLIREIRILRG
jgi:hypothetical protein